MSSHSASFGAFLLLLFLSLHFFFSFPCFSHSCGTLSLPSLHFFLLCDLLWGLLHLEGLEVRHDEPHPRQPFACLDYLHQVPMEKIVCCRILRNLRDLHGLSKKRPRSSGPLQESFAVTSFGSQRAHWETTLVLAANIFTSDATNRLPLGPLKRHKQSTGPAQTGQQGRRHQLTLLEPFHHATTLVHSQLVYYSSRTSRHSSCRLRSCTSISFSTSNPPRSCCRTFWGDQRLTFPTRCGTQGERGRDKM